MISLPVCRRNPVTSGGSECGFINRMTRSCGVDFLDESQKNSKSLNLPSKSSFFAESLRNHVGSRPDDAISLRFPTSFEELESIRMREAAVVRRSFGSIVMRKAVDRYARRETITAKPNPCVASMAAARLLLLWYQNIRC